MKPWQERDWAWSWEGDVYRGGSRLYSLVGLDYEAARLIAAAPELARACDELTQAIGAMAVPLRSDVMDAYRNAIEALVKAGVHPEAE